MLSAQKGHFLINLQRNCFPIRPLPTPNKKILMFIQLLKNNAFEKVSSPRNLLPKKLVPQEDQCPKKELMTTAARRKKRDHMIQFQRFKMKIILFFTTSVGVDFPVGVDPQFDNLLHIESIFTFLLTGMCFKMSVSRDVKLYYYLVVCTIDTMNVFNDMIKKELIY